MVNGYGQHCPVTRALDVVGDRWTLVIVRDLLDGPRRFSRLRRDLSGISPTLLSQRLARLVEAGVIHHAAGGYALTARGEELAPVVVELARWGLALMEAPGGDGFHEHFDRLGLQFLVRPEALPDRGFSVLVELDDRRGGATVETLLIAPANAADHPARRLHVEAGSTGRPDLHLRSSLGALTRLRQGRIGVEELRRRGLLQLEGPARLRSALLAALGPPPETS